MYILSSAYIDLATSLLYKLFFMYMYMPGIQVYTVQVQCTLYLFHSLPNALWKFSQMIIVQLHQVKRLQISWGNPWTNSAQLIVQDHYHIKPSTTWHKELHGHVHECGYASTEEWATTYMYNAHTVNWTLPAHIDNVPHHLPTCTCTCTCT